MRASAPGGWAHLRPPGADDWEREARERTADHEAAHAVAARAFGLSAGPVTIEAGRSYRGLCFHGAPRSKYIAATGPVALWPLSLRRVYERDAIIALAGEAGEELYDGERLSRRRPVDREEAVRTVHRVFERHTGRLPRAERVKLQEASEREGEEREVSRDWGFALRAAGVLAGENVAALTPWLRAQTLELVANRWPQVQVVAAALLERGTLSKREIRELLAE